MQLRKIKLDRKGQAGFFGNTIGDIPMAVKLILISGIFLAVGLIMNDSLFDSVEQNANPGCTASSDLTVAASNCTVSQSIVRNVSKGLINISTNMPLIGTIIGLTVVLGIVLFLGARGGA